MAEQSKGNYNALTWLQAELQQSLNLALSCLDQYEHEGDYSAVLTEAVEALYRAQGSLEMIHLDGATLLVTEMHALTSALQTNHIAQPARAIVALKTQLLRLSTYLNLLRTDFPDHTLCLLDGINELRRIQGQPVLRETDVFQLDLTTVLPDSIRNAATLPVTAELPEPEQFGQSFQASLLTWLSDQDDDSLQAMLTMVQQLKQRSQQPASIILWWAAESVLISLQQKTLPVSATNRILLGRLVTPIKRQCEQGEVDLVAQLPETLLSELALQVAISNNSHPSVIEFIKTFGLRFIEQKQKLESELERATDNSAPNLSALHQHLLNDLRQYQNSEDFQQAALESLGQQLQTLAEHLAQQGEYEASNLLHHQIDQIDVLLAESQRPDQELLAEIIAAVEQVSHWLRPTPEPNPLPYSSETGTDTVETRPEPVTVNAQTETGVTRYLQRLNNQAERQQTNTSRFTSVDRYLIQQLRQQSSETTVARYLRQLINESETAVTVARPLTSVDRYLLQQQQPDTTVARYIRRLLNESETAVTVARPLTSVDRYLLQQQQPDTTVARYIRRLLNESETAVTVARPLTSVDRYLLQLQTAQPMTSVARYIAAQHPDQQANRSLSLLDLLEKTDELLEHYTQQLHDWQYGPNQLVAHTALAQTLAKLTTTTIQAQQPVLAEVYQTLTALIQQTPHYQAAIEPLLNRGYDELSQHIEALLHHHHLVQGDFQQHVADYLASQRRCSAAKPFSVMQTGLYSGEIQQRTMPISVEKLSSLSGLTDSLTQSNRQLITEQTAAKQQIELLHSELTQLVTLMTHDAGDPNLMNRFLPKLTHLQERIHSVQTRTSLVQSMLKQQASLSVQLTDTMTQAQLRPFHQDIAPLQQLVNDIAAQQNKAVQLDVFNAHIKLDSGQLVLLVTQLESLLVLIVTHCMETTAVREAADKEEIAPLNLVLQQHHTELEIQILTDGLPLQQSELHAHLLSMAAETDSRVECISLGGLHGLRLALPLVSCELNCLLVQSNNDLYALPFETVANIERIASENIEALLAEAAPFYRYQGASYPLQHLTSWLDVHASPSLLGSTSTVVVLNDQDISLALVVDKVINQQKLIVKALDRSVAAIKSIRGGAIVEQDKLVLLLNLP